MPTSTLLRDVDTATSPAYYHSAVSVQNYASYHFAFTDRHKKPDVVKVYFKVDNSTVFTAVDYFEFETGEFEDQPWGAGIKIFKSDTSSVDILIFSQIPSGYFYIRTFFFN